MARVHKLLQNDAEKIFHKPRPISAFFADQTMPQCNMNDKVEMRKSMIIAAALAICGSANASESLPLLTGKKLQQAISGKTVHIQTPLGSIPIRYQPNGTMTGVSSTKLAALAGESVNADKGRWWVRRAELCQQWSKWSESRTYCYKLRKHGNVVHWSRNDGKSGQARLSN